MVTEINGERTLEFEGIGGVESQVAMSASGNVVVTKMSQDVPKVFSARGMYVRVLAGRGSGPGEVPNVMWIASSRDTLRVFSRDRETVFDGAWNYTATRTGPSAGLRSPVASMALLSGGSTVTVTTLLEPSAVSGQYVMPVYLRPAAGQGQQRFALGDVVDGNQRVHISSAKAVDQFWAVGLRRGGGYFVALYNVAGHELMRLDRTPNWWVSAPDGQFEAARSTPEGIREDSLGRLIVLVQHPKTNWRQIRLPPNRDQTMRYDTTLEILDPRSKTLIGHRSIPGRPVRILADGFVATYTEVNDYPVLRIFRIE